MASNRQSLPVPVNTEMVQAHSIAALVALLLSVVFGVIVALQFVYPDITEGSLSLGWGRLRYAHTQGIMLGWLGNAFIAFLYHAVPILTQREVTSQKLGWLIFGLWNFVAVIPGWILVLSGISQPLEWAEFPLIIDPVHYHRFSACCHTVCPALPSPWSGLPVRFKLVHYWWSGVYLTGLSHGEYCSGTGFRCGQCGFWGLMDT